MEIVHDSLEEQLAAESLAMASWALRHGLPLPENVASQLALMEEREGGEQLGAEEVELLTTIHAQLAALIAPAQPGSVRLLETEARRSGLLRLFGPVSMVRRLMFMTALSLVAFLLLAATEYVDGEPDSYSLFLTDGKDLLMNQGFLLAAASIGACFFSLHQAGAFLRAGTYNPRFESTYWIRYGLGLLSGVILATIIPVEEWLEGVPTAEGESGGAVVTTFQGFGKPLIALLGGFSASVVYRILTRLVAAVETIVQADAKQQVAAAEQAMKLKLAESELAARTRLVGGVTELLQRLGDDVDPETIRAELQRLQLALLPSDGGVVPAPSQQEPAEGGAGGAEGAPAEPPEGDAEGRP